MKIKIGKYLYAKQQAPYKEFLIYNNKNEELGIIYYYSVWKKYIYQDLGNGLNIYDTSCLNDIKNFIEKLS